MTNWIIITILSCIGIFDLYLYFTKQPTFTQRIHRLFPEWLDLVILGVILGCVWWLGSGPETFIPVMVGVILGHLLWND